MATMCVILPADQDIGYHVYVTCRASIEKYLLEKSRIISQAPGERYVSTTVSTTYCVCIVLYMSDTSGCLSSCDPS